MPVPTSVGVSAPMVKRSLAQSHDAYPDLSALVMVCNTVYLMMIIIGDG